MGSKNQLPVRMCIGGKTQERYFVGVFHVEVQKSDL